MRISDWSSDVCSSDLLEDRARGQCRDEGGRDDLDQEGGQRRFVRLLLILGDRAGIERRWVDVHSGAGLKDIGDDQPDDQREGREEEEIGEGLERQQPERLALADRGDAGRAREEEPRREDLSDQYDEAVADWLQRPPPVGP